MRCQHLVLLLFLVFVLPYSESSFLFRIDTVPPAYLFGTVHVAYTSVWDDIPDNVKKALEQSGHVYLELDTSDPDTLTELVVCVLLPEGEEQQQLAPETAERLNKILPEGSAWEHKRLVWVLMELLVFSLEKEEGDVPALDPYLAQLARETGKQLSALETVDDQCEPINTLDSHLVEFAINHTLDYVEQVSSGNLTSITDETVQQYKKGSFDKDTLEKSPWNQGLRALTAEEKKMADEVDKHFQESLFDKRDEKMSAKIVDLLLSEEKGESLFFALGAAHLVGSHHNVVDRVRAAGFKVVKVEPWEVISGSRSHYCSLSVLVAALLLLALA